MGAWGTGLYASDAAADLRPTVSSVVRLPIEADEVVAVLVENEPALSNPEDEDYTDCWFVVADRFHRYGIAHEPTLALVRQLIDEGTDLDMKREQGMQPADLRAREKVLTALRDRLGTPHPKPYRTRTITKPQPFTLDVGEVITYPTMRGKAYNPYMTAALEKRYPFTPNGVGGAAVIDRGHAFGYLAWYTALAFEPVWATEPTLDTCMTAPGCRRGSGTLSRSHHKKMQITVLGHFDPTPLEHDPSAGVYAAVHDISIANVIGLGRPLMQRRKDDPPSLQEMLDQGDN